MVQIRWEEPIELEMPDGKTYQIRPGHRRRGIAVERIDAKRPASSGRPPQAATMQLRQKLAHDLASGRLQSHADYIAWLQGQDPDASFVRSRHLVHREMRRLGHSTGAPGRRLLPSTAELRKRMERDAAKGKLDSPPQYVKWLMGRHPEIGKAPAQQTVYRELARVKG